MGTIVVTMIYCQEMLETMLKMPAKLQRFEQKRLKRFQETFKISLKFYFYFSNLEKTARKSLQDAKNSQKIIYFVGGTPKCRVRILAQCHVEENKAAP